MGTEATETITVGATPIQITDGTNCALISTLDSYSVNFAHSDVSPEITSGDFLRDKMVVGPPLKIWIWNTTSRSLKVAVTRWEEQV